MQAFCTVLVALKGIKRQLVSANHNTVSDNINKLDS